MTELLLGVDDTDVIGHKPGTGRLARELGADLEAQGLARLVGVVRQQLLVDPRIPYTSHNSPACLVLAADDAGALATIFAAAARYVTRRSARGSDPGLCIAPTATVGEEVKLFGVLASLDVVTQEDALTLARQEGIRLEALGGSGDGVIGALAGVGLTAAGNAGRFLEYAGGLRNLGDPVAAGVLRERGIALLNLSRNAEPIPNEARIRTGDRVRPRLLAGKPVLLVESGPDGWRCFDRKDPKPQGHAAMPGREDV